MFGVTFNDPKKLCDKHGMVMNNNLDIHRDCQHKTIFIQFFLSTDDPVLKGERAKL